MMRYGYTRVRSTNRNLSRQIEALVSVGVTYKRIYKNKEMGTSDGYRHEGLTSVYLI